MRNILSAVFIFFTAVATMAQNTINGKIIDNNKNPLIGVSVLVKGTTKGTQTDFDGNFQIRNVNENQILQMSSIGYKTREIKVKNFTNNSTIILYEGNELLQEVVVSAERRNKFSRKETAYVSKLPLKDLENMQVYTTVTNELLQSQITTSFDEALTNATGLNKRWEATGRSAGEGTGYYSIRGFAAQPGLVDGVAGYTFSTLDPSYIERIEVIKGPSATLFGSNSRYNIGGQINIVTKKPHEGTGGSVNYTIGSFNTHRTSVDFNTPLGDKNAPYFRVNASYLSKGSWQDAGFVKTFFIAPSLSYRVNNRLNFQLGLEFSKTKQTNPPMLFLRRGLPFVSKNTDELKLDHNKSFTSNDVYLTTPTFNTRFIADYKISDQWNSQTIFASSYSTAKGYYQYLFEGGASVILLLGQVTGNEQLQPLKPIIDPMVNPMLQEAGAMVQQDLFTRIYDKRDNSSMRFNIQQNFTGDFKIGDLRNRMVIGLDYVNTNLINKAKTGNVSLLATSNFPQLLGFFDNPPSPPVPQAYIPALKGIGQLIRQTYSGIPYFDAFLTPQGNVYSNSFTPNAKYSPTKEQLDAVFDAIEPNNDDYSSQTLAAYFSNVINISSALNISFGARVDHFIQSGLKISKNDNYSKTTFSPRAGFVYQPILNKLSVFGNYQTGFINVDPQFSITKDQVTRVFEPIKSQQFEGGIKTNLFNNKLNLGASYYYITVNNRTVTDPSGVLLPVSVPIEEIVSKGIELELNANPFKGLNIRASYSYNDTKITNAFTPEFNGKPGYVITQIQGIRTEEAGPESLYNFWVDYKFGEEAFLKNVGLGVGLNGASEFFTINNISSSKRFTIPSYTIYNAGIYYDVNKFRVGIKANNISNVKYYTGWSTVNPQAPRAFLGTISYKF